MAKNNIRNLSSGVSVEVNNIHGNPYCEHGPTVLFARPSDGGNKRYYACSACRDRKICPFYLEEEKLTEFAAKDYSSQELKLFKEHVAKFKNYQRCSKTDTKKIAFCDSCNNVLRIEKMQEHLSCDVKEYSKSEIQSPSQVLSPKNNSKFEAQYFFTENSLKVIISTLQSLAVGKVLCVGAPRIHEFIQKNSNLKMKSLLLDIDNRFINFFSTKTFCLYNIFNHYFLCGKKSKNNYTSFLESSDKILLLIDPPFGGRMELIANTFRLIEKDWRQVNNLSENKILPVLFIFPYFLEKSIKANMPSFSMLEYQVDYDNHDSYTTGPRGMKQGSAVRIFTNLSPHLFTFPEDEGYTFCKPCNRSVHSRNVHCSKCNDCTSKDGRTYVHCDICTICVKPQWIHCQSCSRCLPKDHTCKLKDSTRKKYRGNISFPSKRKRDFDFSSRRVKNPKKKIKIPLTFKEEHSRDMTILQQILK